MVLKDEIYKYKGNFYLSLGEVMVKRPKTFLEFILRKKAKWKLAVRYRRIKSGGWEWNRLVRPVPGLHDFVREREDFKKKFSKVGYYQAGESK